MRIFGRDPAFWTGLAAVVIQFLVAWGLKLDEGQQAGINAVVTLVFGVVVAWSVARDQVVPIASSLLVAALNLFVSFGFDISPDKIAAAGALAIAVLTGYLRTQTTAPIAPDGSPVPRVTVHKAS
jgi:hypothetical protein